jgi:ABC-type dipeptide/oligopeptide/nickel transport system permease component
VVGRRARLRLSHFRQRDHVCTASPAAGTAELPPFLVLVVIFFAFRLSGDPVALMLADYAMEQQKQQLRHSLGLDQPLPVQFAIYVG